MGAERNEFTYTFEPFPPPPAKQRGHGEPRETGARNQPAAKPPHEYTLQFTLRDTDGFKARDPIFLTLVPVPDEPPEVKVRLVGTREPVVTPKGRLPVTGTITDDHGLGRAWWGYTVEERAAPAIPAKPSGDSSQKPGEPPKAPPQRSGEVPLAELPKHLAEYVVKEADVKASQLSLATGQRLTLAVRAADLCTFGNGPNIGSGESWQLDVVSEDELVTRLEARELLVKQRFEAIVEEMTETRNLLLKMDFTPPEKAVSAAPKAKSAGAEPGERAEELPKFSADELNKRRLERTLQALQNCRKNALETADVAAAIEEIRLQLDNNQANNETRKKRIENQVLQPLHYIVESMFPAAGTASGGLAGGRRRSSAGPGRRDAAQKQADQILAKMRDVLDHMMKTEDFNINVVQRLKKIIERQKELTRRTEKSRTREPWRKGMSFHGEANRMAVGGVDCIGRFAAAQAAGTKEPQAEAGKVCAAGRRAGLCRGGPLRHPAAVGGRIQRSPGHPHEDAGPGPPDRSESGRADREGPQGKRRTPRRGRFPGYRRFAPPRQVRRCGPQTGQSQRGSRRHPQVVAQRRPLPADPGREGPHPQVPQSPQRHHPRTEGRPGPHCRRRGSQIALRRTGRPGPANGQSVEGHPRERGKGPQQTKRATTRATARTTARATARATASGDKSGDKRRRQAE